MNFVDFKEISQAGKEEKIKHSSFIYRQQRWLSVILSWLLIKINPKILPNHVSIFNVVVLWLVFMSVIFFSGQVLVWLVLVQLLLLAFSSILDKVDGEIARYRQYFTQTGLYFDLVYHFSYAFIFYVVLAYYFAYLANNLLILWLGILVGLWSAIYHMLGKIRHHIKYKVSLEGHTAEIKDWLDLKAKKPRSKFFTLADYGLLFIYDWVWLIYMLCWVLSILNWPLAASLFVIHLLLTAIRLVSEIVYLYPRHNLFTRPD